MTNGMETDSFILVLRRFTARRGNGRTIRCDNGSIFVGAERELAKSMKQMNDNKIHGSCSIRIQIGLCGREIHL